MEKIDDLAAKAQERHKQGRILDAIKYFEKALDRRIDLLGPDDRSVKRACEQLCDVLNGAALKHLQNEEYEKAREMLEKAETLTGPDDLVTSVTYNNMACYWRRRGKLRTALSYLEKAQRIEMKSSVVANPAGTRLNLCAVLSQLERHQEARDHAQAATFLLQEELSRLSMDSDDGQEARPEVLNKMAVLAISYHNIGVEEEYLRHHAESLEAYARGVEIARNYLGADNDITKTLTKSCAAAQEHLDASKLRKGLSSAHGPALNGPYQAMQQHNHPRRRAQSAGASRSNSTTPSWALNTSNKLSTSGSGPRSGTGTVTGTRVSSATSQRDSASASPPASHFLPAPTRDNPSTRRPASALPVARAEASRAAQQRPGSAFAVLSHTDRTAPAPAMSTAGSTKGTAGVGVKKGPVTPRLSDGQAAVSVLRPASGSRRPVSASTREPVRANLSMFQTRRNAEPAPKHAERGLVTASTQPESAHRSQDQRGRRVAEVPAPPRQTYSGGSDLMLERPPSLVRGGSKRPLASHAERVDESDELSAGSIVEDQDSTLSGLSNDDDDDVSAELAAAPASRERNGAGHERIGRGVSRKAEELSAGTFDPAAEHGAARAQAEDAVGGRRAFAVQRPSDAARSARPARPSDTSTRAQTRQAGKEEVHVLEDDGSKYTSSDEEAEAEPRAPPMQATATRSAARYGGAMREEVGRVRTPDGRKWIEPKGLAGRGEGDEYASPEEDEEAEVVVDKRRGARREEPRRQPQESSKLSSLSGSELELSKSDNGSQRSQRPGTATRRGGREKTLAEQRLQELRALVDEDVEISADSSDEDLFKYADHQSEEEGDEDEEELGKADAQARRAESLKWVEFDLKK